MKRLPGLFPGFVLFYFVVCLSLFSEQASAATRTWTGTNSGLWSNAGNWGGTAPVAGDDLVFPGGALNLTNVNDFPAGTNFNSITFSGASGGYDIGGNALTLGAGGITTNNTSGFHAINLNVTLGAPQTFALVGELDLNAALNLGSNTLTVNNAFSSFFQGAMTGSGGLVKNGAGQLIYNGPANTCTGTTTVNAGILRLSKTTAGTDAIAGPLVISGGTVALAKDNQINDTSAVTVNGTGVLDLQPFGTTHTETIASLSATGNLLLGLNGPTAGSGYSQLNVTGNVNITGATLNLTLGFVPIPSQTFTIINNSSVNPVTGVFSGLPQGSFITAGTTNFTISYAGGTGNDVVLTAVSAASIPTLSEWMLAALALLLLGYGVHMQRGWRRNWSG